ncbi:MULTISPECIES: DUF1801 domain-containing protein [unclassified Paenibacillus]|uniref:DUF1801 domain-containing protein n=1 Tax=unclassified Paenibacillus TaxID=185978 RepID=UPI001C10DBB1|nr:MULTISPECIES: DUF1801 domain-containing protein [unclassified Paenibacillus]MBU5443657.1 DUF1801 domain-containing protein [Paenibacillus sp. MSJ-34]CAH0117680.1 hypothetical protein PAE9249_00140 [Paenibacillus sp. CECT 9249]
MAKAAKRSDSELVAEFMKHLEHPLKREIEEVRQIIANAHPELKEHIKWNAPSFHYQGEDRVTFNLRSKDYLLLVFHCGAKVKKRAGKEPLFEDTTGLLEWAAADRATAKLYDMNDVIAKRDKLVQVIGKWLEVN